MFRLMIFPERKEKEERIRERKQRNERTYKTLELNKEAVSMYKLDAPSTINNERAESTINKTRNEGIFFF
jgi:parvulin-like peptidyl-prolyl isomerase